MKKYTFVLFGFILSLILIGFNVKSVNAYDSGCTGAGPYSTKTGLICSTSTTASECASGDLFSYVTGKACNTTQDNSSNSSSSNQQFQIGSKGDDVKAFQQTLSNAGFSPGKIDGIYGPMTDNAAVKYYKKYPHSTIPPLPNSSPITVLSPNGGENWVKETTQTISWKDTSICPIGGNCIQLVKSYDITLQTYYPPCTSNICPMIAYRMPYTIAKNVSGASYNWLVGKILDSSNYVASGVPNGSYSIQICQTGTTTCDSSNAPFNITDTTTSVPVISGVSGPQTLNVNQTGTWAVTASDPNGGNLSYSVSWGDEGYQTSNGMFAMLAPQQSATFTHSYVQAGIYTPTFTVKNNTGQSAQTSLSVTVGNVTTACALTAQVVSTNFAENNTTWGFDVKVNATNKPSTSNGWTANFEGYIPEITAYGTTKHYGNFFLSSGPLQFTPWDQVDTNCRTTITVNPPVSSSSVTVISPNGGEILVKIKSGLTIKWRDETASVAPTYDIKLLSYPYDQQYIIVRGVNGLSFNWPAGTIENGSAPAGSYKIQVCQNGTTICDSSDTPFTIIDNTIPAPSISSLSPASGHVGTSVTITGSGFTATGNKIKFGNLNSENNPYYNLNSNGTSITFTVPTGNYYACWDTNPACYIAAVFTQPGTYPVSVINANGTSNAVNFTVATNSSN